MKRSLASYSLALALAGCGGGAVTSGSPALPFDRPPPRMLVLGEEARGDTSTPDGRASSSCKNGGRAGQALDHLYGFEVKETASYRFELTPAFDGVIQVQQKRKEKPWYFGIGCAASGPGKKAVVSVPLEPGLYWVVVDGNLWDEDGPYTLLATRDTSSTALIGAEDPAKLEALLAKAPVVKMGERAYGVYRSSAGGARTSCGLLNGDGVQKLSLDRPARVRLRAAAHFPLALEVRPGTKDAKPICQRAAEGRYESEITVDLDAGEHVIVLDALALGFRDPYGGNAQEARVFGAYIIDVEEVPR